MLKQLEDLRSPAFEIGSHLLVQQALFLAIQKEISWIRIGKDDFEAEVLLGLPGQEPVATKVLFHIGYGYIEPPVTTYYLSVGDKKGPCRNSSDQHIKFLAKELFDAHNLETA